MFPLEQYRTDALAMDVGPFADKYAHSFLVHTAHTSATWGEAMEWSTAIASREAPPASHISSSWAIPLKKRPGNPHPDQLSVGRARSCDIVLRYSFLSKLHAQFLVTDKGLKLRDLKSANGTKVNAVALQAMETVKIEPGDRISFGQLHVRLATAAVFHAQLRAPEPPASSRAFRGPSDLAD
jgi:hypothetical protein